MTSENMLVRSAATTTSLIEDSVELRNRKQVEERATQRQSADATMEKVDTALRKAQELAHSVNQEHTRSVQIIEDVGDTMRAAVETLNEVLRKTPFKALITKDDQLNRFIVKITDSTSGQIIREIPNDAMLKFARNLEAMKGILFDVDA